MPSGRPASRRHVPRILRSKVHRAPGGRMLIAQATVESLTLVTRKRAVAAYDVPLLPA